MCVNQTSYIIFRNGRGLGEVIIIYVYTIHYNRRRPTGRWSLTLHASEKSNPRTHININCRYLHINVLFAHMHTCIYTNWNWETRQNNICVCWYRRIDATRRIADATRRHIAIQFYKYIQQVHFVTYIKCVLFLVFIEDETREDVYATQRNTILFIQW